MSQTTYANSPLRCCETCAYLRPDLAHEDKHNQIRFAQCARFNLYASTAQDHRCTVDLKEWRLAPPPPPRKSIRQRLYDYWLA